MRHLWGARGRAVVVLDHAVVQLWRHADDHVVVVRVEVLAFGHVQAERRVVVVAGHQVVRVVDVARVVRVRLRKVLRPQTPVCALRLMHREIRRPDAVMDHALSVVPLLEVVALVPMRDRLKNPYF